VIAQLHEHERVELANHKAWNEILHALVDSIADGTAEEIGQRLLLVAYAPAIHKVYREVCKKFPGLSEERRAARSVRVDVRYIAIAEARTRIACVIDGKGGVERVEPLSDFKS